MLKERLGTAAWFMQRSARAMLARARSSLRSLSWVVALVVGFTAAPADALQRATPQSIRVTSGANHRHSTGRSWGRYLAVSSSVDLTGEGSAGSQAYVFSVADYACRFGRPELNIPATEPLECPTPARPYLVRATRGTPEDRIDNPSVNETGKIVAFEAMGSYRNACARTPGAARRRQVFIENLETGRTHPVTCNPDGDSYAPSLNAAGGTLAFVSTSAFLGAPPGIPQVYVYQYQNPNPERVGEMTSVTYGRFARGQAASGAPMLNRFANHVVFESRADLLGTGLDTGIWNIFWFDRATERLFQLTAGNGDSRNPYIEEKRPGSIFFDSIATNLPGWVGPGRQIFRASTRDNGRLESLSQITFGPGNSWMPAVEPNGGKLLFLSDGDLLANGTTGPRLFALRLDGPGTLYQITGRGRIEGRIGANIGAWFASFATDDDVGGYGTCGRQLWITVYDPEHYVEAGHVRAPATRPGMVPAEPFPGDPNAGCDDVNPCTADTCLRGQVCVNAVLPAGSPCGQGDLCSGGRGICNEAGRCSASGPLQCDDGNPCTDDVCDPEAGCTHTEALCDDRDPCTVDSCDPGGGCRHAPPSPMESLACQTTSIKGLTPQGASRRMVKKVRRAARMVESAARKGSPDRGRKLRKARVLFQTVLPDIVSDPAFSRDQANALIDRIYALLDQIALVLAELRNRSGDR